MNKILIIGASGFVGNAIYKELAPYFDVYGTYNTKLNFSINKRFLSFNMELDSIYPMLQEVQPNYIITALRGDFQEQIHAHLDMIDYVREHPDCKIIFISSANVFDRFNNFPSYEFDKTLSESKFGYLKIRIENAIMRLDNDQYLILRVPMIFGHNTPRIREIQQALLIQEPIEVFPNVVINTTSIKKLTQQIHFLINHDVEGIYHLGSNDLIHHIDFIKEVCRILGSKTPKLKQVFDTNEDRYLAVLPKDNLLPKHLQITNYEVIEQTVL